MTGTDHASGEGVAWELWGRRGAARQGGEFAEAGAYQPYLPKWVMGLASAVLVWRTGSLRPSIILHVAFNLLITFGSYISYQWPV